MHSAPSQSTAYHSAACSNSNAVRTLRSTPSIDTGAAVTVMSERDYERLRREERIPPLTLVVDDSISGVDDVQLEVIGVVSVEVELDGEVEEVTWKVVRNAGCHLLLGNDSLSLLRVKIDYNNGTWEWNRGEPRQFSVVQHPDFQQVFLAPQRGGWVDLPDLINDSSDEEDELREGEITHMPEGLVDEEEEREDTGIGEPQWGIKPDPAFIRSEIRRVVEESDLSREEKWRLQELLLEYEDVFVDQLYEAERANYAPHRIDTGNHPPIFRASYRVSPQERELIHGEVDKLLKAGVIHPSQSPWRAPVVIARKKDRGPRFCTRIDDLLDILGKAPYRSTFDFALGYWQIAVAEENKEKTAFVTSEGIFEYNVVPMGLTNSPSSFQRNMNAMLGDARGKYAVIYVDNLLAFSMTFEEHLQYLRDIFERVRKVALKIKIGKSQLVRKEMDFLGHVLRGQEILPDPTKIDKVANAGPLKNVKELQRFLGLAGYYRRFIKGYATIAEPLTRLLHKAREYKWKDEQQRAFEELKRRLTEASVLGMPDWTHPFIFQPDASGVAIGAILAQEDEEGHERVIHYASRVLSPAERNCSATERELLAVVWGAKEFRPYLHGNEAILETDHKAIKWLAEMRQSSARLTRWALILQEYSFQIKHKPGRNHVNADAMSRVPIVDEDRVKESARNWVFNVVEETKKKVAKEQREDEEIGELIAYLERGDLPSDEKRARRVAAEAGQMWLDESGRLFRTWWPQGAGQRDDTRRQLVVPPSLRKAVLRSAHDDLIGGHLGTNKVYARIREHYWWPSMYRDVKDWVQTCESCQARRNPRTGKAGELEPIPVHRIFERVGMDLVGPLPLTPRGNKYLLTFTEYLSGWPEAFAIKDDKAETVAKHFVEDWVCRYGAPEIVNSDRGRQFIGELMQEVCRLLAIEQAPTTSYHPAGNGKDERWHSVWAEMTSKYVSDEQTDWDLYVPYLAAACRFSIKDSSGDSPFFVFFGREPISPLDVVLGVDTLAEDSKFEMVQRVSRARELAKRNLEWAQGRQKETSMWKGPYIIIDRRNSNNYLIRGVDKFNDIHNVHVERLKPYRSAEYPIGELEVQEVRGKRVNDKGIKEYLVR